MKITPMRQKMTLLREAINERTLDQIEIMLNNAKGTGTTNLLIEMAQRSSKIPIIVESEEVAEMLKQSHPNLIFHPYTKQLPGQRVLIDVSTHWTSLRAGQKVRKLGEDLLNWMEFKNPSW